MASQQGAGGSGDAVAVRERLRASLTPLARQAGREVVEDLVREVLATGRWAADPVEALARALLETARALHALEERFDDEAQLLRAAVATGWLADGVRDVLRRTGTGGGWLTAWLTRGQALSAEAVEDRLALRRQEAVQRVGYLLSALVGSGVSSLPDGLRGSVAQRAVELLTVRARPWTLRVEAARLVAALAQAEAPGHPLRRALLRQALQVDDEPWVVACSAEAYLSLPDGQAEAAGVLEHLLWPPVEVVHRDYLFTRARAAGLCARHGAVALLERLLDEEGLGEHVRWAAWRALCEAGEGLVALRRLSARTDERTRTLVGVVAVEQLVGGAGERGARLLGAVLQLGGGAVVEVVLDALLDRALAGAISETAVGLLAAQVGAELRRLAGEQAVGPDARRLAAVLTSWLSLQRSEDTRGALAQVAAWLAVADEGDGQRFDHGPVARLSADQLLDVLFVLSHDDLDLSALPLGVADAALHTDRLAPGGYQLFVGLRGQRAAWRLVHELRNPRNDKRQAFHHTVDLLPGGSLIAWSAGLSEVTPTGVPGCRVSTPTTLDWSEHLPLPVNLLAASQHGAVRVRTPSTDVVLRAEGPRSRVLAHQRYVALDGVRRRLCELSEAEAVPRWDQALGEAGYRVERSPRWLGVAAWPSLQGWRPGLASDVDSFTQIAALSAVAVIGFLGTAMRRAAEQRRWRRSIPLVVGGWGSRGKSSVERLKAALFQGLGYTVLCKSTGCEAMLLLGLPGRAPVEVFLYRPRDKATIVEQRRVLQLAYQMRPQVLLWECMALNPDYTEILQNQWMRDDLSTITNTYPDHEDIQGPSGRDVADVISTFTPTRGTVLTTEQHMRPVLRRRARDRETRFVACRAEHWSLLPRDLLARFPYTEHPRNLSLVVRLASELGVAWDVAVRTMADHVLPDLGAFRTYGPVPVEGRRLSFINGHSANERASFVSNWDRMHLSEVPEGSGLRDWLVLVVNNRGDRLARQAIFARLVATEVAVDRIVIIGTNVAPMRDQIEELLRTELPALLLNLVAVEGGRKLLVELFARRLRRPILDPEAAEARLAALLPAGVQVGATPAGGEVGPLAEPMEPSAQWAALAAAWREEVGWLYGLAHSDGWDVHEVIAQFARRIGARVSPFTDPAITGDQILTRIARSLPDGSQATLLGSANIKGTGLDFVYRWVSVGRVHAALDALDAARDPLGARQAVAVLDAHEDYGLLDARWAVERLQAFDPQRARALDVAAELEAVLLRLRGVVKAREAALWTRKEASGGWRARLKGLWKQADVWSQMRRSWRADGIYRALGARRLGMVEASKLAQAVVEEGK